MITIGFGGTFYTLWEVTRYVAWTGGSDPKPYWATAFAYYRNLSMDFDKAKEKVVAAFGEIEYAVDITLHGSAWFMTRSEMSAEERKAYEKDYTFTFGRYKGQDIRVIGDWIALNRIEFDANIEMELYNIDNGALSVTLSEETKAAWRKAIEDRVTHRDYNDAKELKDVIWQLERAMKSESTARRKVYARRRLIELGGLVRRDWIERVLVADPYDGETIATRGVKHKWMPKGLAKWQDEIGSKKGLFYKDGERVELTIKEHKAKAIPTDYGTMWIITFFDQDGHIVTYKGSKLIQEPNDENRFLAPEERKGFKVKATIKHDAQRGETYLQRIKIVTK